MNTEVVELNDGASVVVDNGVVPAVVVVAVFDCVSVGIDRPQRNGDRLDTELGIHGGAGLLGSTAPLTRLGLRLDEMFFAAVEGSKDVDRPVGASDLNLPIEPALDPDLVIDSERRDELGGAVAQGGQGEVADGERLGVVHLWGLVTVRRVGIGRVEGLLREIGKDDFDVPQEVSTGNPDDRRGFEESMGSQHGIPVCPDSDSAFAVVFGESLETVDPSLMVDDLGVLVVCTGACRDDVDELSNK